MAAMNHSKTSSSPVQRQEHSDEDPRSCRTQEACDDPWTRVIVAAASALVIVFAVFAVATAGEGDAPPLGPETLPGFLRSPAQLLGFVALLIGVIAVAGEWTHRTVTRTFLLTPARRRVVMAKMLTGVIVGVGVSVLALMLGLLVVLPRAARQRHCAVTRRIRRGSACDHWH
jgi:multisubunit Na+/H+ antiporter MnhC subunit